MIYDEDVLYLSIRHHRQDALVEEKETPVFWFGGIAEKNM